LIYIKDNLAIEAIDAIQKLIEEKLLESGFTNIDYVAICNAETLKSLTKYTTSTPSVALIAAYIDGVRLIDNMLICG
jgi:pantoate--beta-alanine ligase